VFPKNRDPPAVLHHATLDPVKIYMALIPYWTKKIQREEGCGGTRLDASSRCNAMPTTNMAERCGDSRLQLLPQQSCKRVGSISLVPISQTKRLMQSQDPAKELFSISSRDEHKSTLQTLSLKFDRVPINKYQMHWAVAVLWAGNNVNNEANATEVCTDDSGTNSQKPITSGYVLRLL
jgi:hypothetical protein